MKVTNAPAYYTMLVSLRVEIPGAGSASFGQKPFGREMFDRHSIISYLPATGLSAK
jgi:hypothetical protein